MKTPGKPRLGLSARLLVLTILFVMVAEVMIYVPSVANFRRSWLADRLAAGQIAALVLDATPSGELSPEIGSRLLDGVGAMAVAVRGGGTRRLLAVEDAPPPVARSVDLRDAPWWSLIIDAFTTLLVPAQGPIRVVGAGMGGVDFVEIVIDEAPLRAAMLAFSTNILVLSLLISAITAGLVYLALHALIVRPVRRFSDNVARFSEDPEDVSRIIAPSGRRDELGSAENALHAMETTLASELRSKRHLAELGLAVSKVNHELRNMLTTAQLLSDRLSAVTDPSAQRFAPRLVATLDRAIAFCEATLAYGRASEPLPRRRLAPLAPLVADLSDLAGSKPGMGITFQTDMPGDLVVDADPEQLSRVLVNLVRNAVQALARSGARDGVPTVRVAARRENGAVTIRVEDNGPGLAPRARERLFEAFQGSSQPGGTGLGLAICAEIVRLHGGTIRLDDDAAATGAAFVLVIPDRPDPARS
jgi:signal transduction histidine kinase